MQNSFAQFRVKVFYVTLKIVFFFIELIKPMQLDYIVVVQSGFWFFLFVCFFGVFFAKWFVLTP